MKIRQAKKLLMRPWNKVPKYWMQKFYREGVFGIYVQYRDHRLQKAESTIRRWRENKCK